MKNIKSVFFYYKKLVSILNKRQKRESVLVFICIIASSICEMLGVSVMIPYVSVILNPQELLKYDIAVNIVNGLGISSNKGLIFLMSIFVIMIYAIKNGFLALSDYVCLRYESTIQRDLGVTMLKSYLSRDYEDMLDINTSEAYRGLTIDVTGIYYIIQAFFLIISKSISVLLICAVIFIADPFFSLSLAVVGGVVSLFIVLKLKNTIRSSGKVFNDAIHETTKSAMHALGGLKEITVMQRNSIFLDRYVDANNKKTKVQIKYRFLEAFPSRFIETIFVAGLMAVILLKTARGADLTELLPQLATIAMGTLRIMPYISGISANCGNILYYIPSLNNVCDNIIAARNYSQNTYGRYDTEESITSLDELSFNDVWWKYRGAADYVLKGLSFSVNQGETIGIVGESGAGKTTVADILLGLLHPQNGEINVDNIPIEKAGSTWAKMIGYVPQNIFLLDDSIRNNILFGLPYSGDDDKIWEVLDNVNMKTFVSSLPEGLDTIAGERGVKFSGGQRQRIAIARALYYNPNLLVLDEATSALDNETEEVVMEAIEKLHGKKTLVIIAHRLSSLKNCDRIIKIRDGRAYETYYDQLIQ